MKKITYLFLSAMLMMLFACTQEDVQLGQLVEEQGKASKNAGPVFKVYPTGVDDTETLVQAFADAKVAGPGAVVQLLEGQYTIGMIEVREFNGYFRGAGKGKTIISNLPELPCEEQWEQNRLPALVKFVGGDITVSDLTFHLNDGQPCAFGTLNDANYGDIASVLMMVDYTALFIPEVHHIRAVVNNVDFIAGDDGGYGVYGTKGNVAMTIFGGADYAWPTGVEPLSSADFSISNCTFIDGLCGPDLFGFDENSVVKIENNTIIGGSQQIFIGGFYGTMVTIKDNKLRNSWYSDIYIADNEWLDWGYFANIFSPKRTVFTIVGNDFESPAGVTSIYISDHLRTLNSDYNYPQLFDIKSNTFKTQEGGTAIMGLNNMDAKIWNNTFKGTGAVGVYLEGDAGTETYAQYNKILNNNFSQSNYTGANVYLGEFTANNMVVGVAKDKVTDLGDNNKVVGTKANKNGPHFMPAKNGPHNNIRARRLGH